MPLARRVSPWSFARAPKPARGLRRRSLRRCHADRRAGATIVDVNLAPFRMHSRDEFQTWLALDLEVREELYAMMGRELDVDVASLDALEEFLLKRYQTAEAITALDQRGVADAAARLV